MDVEDASVILETTRGTSSSTGKGLILIATPKRHDADTQAFGNLLKHETPDEIAALRAAGFRLLLEEGRPITATEWGERSRGHRKSTGRDPAIAAMKGRAELDDQGQLLGIAGLTITPTRYQLDIDGATR